MRFPNRSCFPVAALALMLQLLGKLLAQLPEQQRRHSQQQTEQYAFEPAAARWCATIIRGRRRRRGDGLEHLRRDPAKTAAIKRTALL